MNETQSTQTFSATVRKIDVNPYVKVPDDVLRNLQADAQRDKGPLPVKGTLHGVPFSTTVVKFRGLWRLYLNTEMRHAAGVDVGDKVIIGLQFDRNPPAIRAPREFTHALSKSKRAKEAFEALPPSRQKEILRYLNSLKRPETLERNIQKTIRYLEGNEAGAPVAVSRAKKRDNDEVA